jgi:hypothetical protein
MSKVELCMVAAAQRLCFRVLLPQTVAASQQWQKALLVQRQSQLVAAGHNIAPNSHVSVRAA